MRKRKLRFPIRLFLVSILSLAGISLLLFFTIRFLTTSDYFEIKDFDYFNPLDKSIQPDTRSYLEGFIGQNIFKVKLQKASQRLSKLYPDYKHVVLKRLLPNRIIIDFKPRQVVARIKLSEYFYVDEEGVLFNPIGQQDDNLQLPLISGLSTRISHPSSGVKYNEDSLLVTLEFIDSLNKNSDLAKKLKIKEINLANVNDVFLFTTTGCKINLGGIGSLNKDLSILQRLISEINFDLTKVEYIDLRFRKPVVKYK